MNIHGIEVDFNITNPEHYDHYMAGLKLLEQGEKKVRSINDPMAEGINIMEIMLQAVKDFFYEAVGVDVLAECDNVQEAMDTYHLFLKDVAAQKEKLDETVEAFGRMNEQAAAVADKAKPKAVPVQPKKPMDHKTKSQKARPPRA